MKHIYIHFPFCIKKCHYCDFNSYACQSEEIPHEEYVEAIFAEVEGQEKNTGDRRQETEKNIDSIFLGGGTPSLMRPGDVERILDSLQKQYSFLSNIEITLEVNPGSIPVSRLKEFQTAGVNRFSIGVQSFDDVNLKWFGRIHSADEGREMVRVAQNLQGCRVSLDLIYGFPGQSVEDWKRNLEEGIGLGVRHLSAYALTMPEVVGAASVRRKFIRGETPLLPETDNMQIMTYEFMERAGLPAYEISNFAVPGEESRHNLGYWRYEDFWGLGAGAVSQYGRSRLCAANDFVTRTTNLKNPVDYMRAVMKGEIYFEEEFIDEPTAQFEFIMMGLRTREGISEEVFQKRFGESFAEKYKKAIEQGVKHGWLECRGTACRAQDQFAPTIEGFLWNNQLVGEFGPVISPTQV